MKRIFAIFFLFNLVTLLHAQEKEIVIDNTHNQYEDSIIVTNNTDEVITLLISVKRKESSKEVVLKQIRVPPMENRFRVKTSEDGDLDDFDYIIIRSIYGQIINYKEESKNDDLVITINEYEGLQIDRVDNVGINLKNEINIENKNFYARDYIKIQNPTNHYIYFSAYGITKENKEMHVGYELIPPKENVELFSLYNDKLNQFTSFKILTDVKINEFKSELKNNDLLFIIYDCTEPDFIPYNISLETDYDKKDIELSIFGNTVKTLQILHLEVFSLYFQISIILYLFCHNLFLKKYYMV